MNCYLLKRKITHGKVPFTTSKEHRGDIAINCPACGVRGLIGKNMLGKVPVEIIIKDIVSELDDIAQGGTVLFVSKKFRKAVFDNNLTGIEFYPLVGYQLRGKNNLFKNMLRRCQEDADYQVLHVTGSGGSVAESSGVWLFKSCEICGWKEWTLPQNGFHIDESQWDGSDFFHVKEYGPFFMSERAVSALSAAGLNNFGYEPIEDYWLPEDFFEKYKK